MSEFPELVKLSQISKRFKLKNGHQVNAVCDVSLSIGENETVGLVGESGSGKSTLGQLIMGLHQCTSGDIWFAKKMLASKRGAADFSVQAAQMQMVFQNPFSSFNPRMTVSDILEEPLLLSREDRGVQSRQELLRQWIRKVGLLPEYLDRYPHEFSGGQRQRIAIARALISEPKFVVCDEPVSALDLSVQAQIINMMIELKRSMGLTLLFIAHDLSMVRYISDRIAVMYHGRIVEIGDAEAVYRQPIHPYTQLLVESNLVADPDLERQRRAKKQENNDLSANGVGAVGKAGMTNNQKEKGCTFYERCPNATKLCLEKAPELVEINESSQERGSFQRGVARSVACHFTNSHSFSES